MTVQKVQFSLSCNESAVFYLIEELLVGGFSVVSECCGEAWHITGERYLDDGDGSELWSAPPPTIN